MTTAKRLTLISLLLGLTAIWLARSLVLGALLRHLLLPSIHAATPGLQLQFESLDTNLYSRLEFNRLSLDFHLAADHLRLEVPAAKISFSLADLLPWPGKEPWFRHVALDLQSPAITGELYEDTEITLPPLGPLPAIKALDCLLDLKFRGGVAINGQGLTLLAPFYDPGRHEVYEVKLSASATKVAASRGTWSGQEGSLAATINYRPGRLQIPALFFKEALLLENGDVQHDNQGWRFAMGLHLLQSQGLVQGSINRQQEAKLSFHLNEGDLQELTEAAGVMSTVSGHLQADGTLEMTLGKPESLHGTVTAEVVDGSWNGVPVDRLEVKARAGDQVLTIDTLQLLTEENRLTLSAGSAPLATLQKQNWLQLLAASRATATLHVARPELLPAAWSAPFVDDWQALGLESATADLTLHDGHLLLPKAELAGLSGRLRLKDGDLDLSGSLTDWREVPCSFTWQAELSDAAVVHQFYDDWPATGGKAHGQGTFAGTLHHPHLPFEATFLGSSLYGVTLDKVTGRLEWTKDRLALDVTAHNHGERDRLTFRGTIDLGEGGLLATQISTDLGDMHPYLPKALVGDTALSGALAGTASLSGPFAGLTGMIEASGDWTVQGLTLGEAKLETSLAGRQWSVERLSATLGTGLTINTAGRLEASPDWRRTAVDIESLALSYQGQQMDLTAPGGLTVSREALLIRSPLTLVGPPGRLRLEASPPNSTQLTLVGEELRDSGLLKQLSGKDLGFAGMAFTLALNGPLRHPDWRWQGSVQGLTMAGGPLPLDGSFDLTYDDQGLGLRHCSLGNDGQSLDLAGHLPLAFTNRQLTFLPNPLEIKAKVALPKGGFLPQLFPEWLSESGEVLADLALTGSWEQPQGRLEVEAAGLTPGPRLLAALPAEPFSVHGLLDLKKDQVAIERLDASSAGLSLQLAGAINHLPFSELLSHEQEEVPGQVEVSGRYAMPDLAWLAAKLPGLRRTAGTATGTLSVDGPLANPEFQAKLSLRHGEARGSDSLLVFREISMDAALHQQQLTIKELSGTMGGAPVQGSGRVKALFGDEPTLDLHLTGKDLLLYRADGVKIRADTTLALGGTAKAPALSGEIMLTDSRITRRVDWLSFLRPGTRHNGDTTFSLFSFKDPPWKNTHLDLRVKAARPLLIANNVFKGGVRPDLLLAGTGEVPYLTGLLYTDGGRVTLPSGRLEMENGLVRFAEEAPERPQLEFQATGRVMGYDVTAQVRGTYDEPEVTLSSAPPLASEDLLMLMLAGRRPVSAGQTDTGVSTVAVYFGRGLLSRLFGEEAKHSLLLDQLEVDVGRAVTQQGEPTVDARVKLADGRGKTDTSLYLTGEKDIWDYYNGGLRVVFHFR